ncbi:hypothetical protein [Joostella sp.]|uniref:hypothetical protein n=1 Tax=Joostella sp. TaxID=2231138 RepID=UPI003A93CD0A
MATIGDKKYDLFGVKKILIGDPSEDLNEANFDEIDAKYITTNTVQLVKPIPTTTNIDTEGDDAYRTLRDSVDPSQVNFQVYGLPLEYYPLFFGGTYEAGDDEWSAPDSQEDNFKSIIIYTGETDSTGNQIKITLPYCNVFAGFGGNNLTKNAIESISVEAYVNSPVGMTATKKMIIGLTAATS